MFDGNTVAEESRYAKCIEVSKRVRWDIDTDVIKGRSFDYAQKFLPDGLSKLDSLDFLLSADERRLMGQIQGRTYAYLFGLVERFINAKILELGSQLWSVNQVVLQALVRFSDEELKHQELFRRVEAMIEHDMPPGYVRTADPNVVAAAVLSKSTWSVLALTCHIELFTQEHYKQSIEADPSLSPLYKDIFMFHWREESQHAILDELEWRRENARLSDAERDAAVDDLISLVSAVDGILQAQAKADADYFFGMVPTIVEDAKRSLADATLGAYRWQYIASGVSAPRFQALLEEFTTPEQRARIGTALAPILQ